MFPHSALPQEIYDMVINYLHDDEQSLKACSLVASAWRPASQKLLHRTMVFQASLPPPSTGNPGSSAQSSVLGSEKARLLLDTSSHLLRYARSVVVCEDPIVPLVQGDARWRPEPRVPDASLVSLLRNISSLPLLSLTRFELRRLNWAEISPDLQRALVVLLSGGAIKEVSLNNCSIPFSIRWMRFVGPQTTSLKLDDIRLLDDPEAEHEKSIKDMPIPPAPNLISLRIGQVYSPRMSEWILDPSKHPNDPGHHLNSTGTVLRSRSFCEKITILSLYNPYHGRPECIYKFVQAFPSLTTLTFNSYGTQTAFPLNKIIRIPTLNDLHIVVSAGKMPWLLSSFETINSPRYSSVTNLKTIQIHMGVGPGPDASPLPRLTLSNLLVKIRALDGIVATIPNIEVTMLMYVLTHRTVATEREKQTKVTLESWRADVKMLRLDVQ